VIRKRLQHFLAILRENLGAIEGRGFVDSAPVMERAWAARSGLGWIGNHSLLLRRRVGSFFFIAELICDLELEYDSHSGSYCGRCHRCMEACPTGAIVEPHVVDARKCISYLTIEYNGERLPEQFRDKFGNKIFGCDICQQVCPYNKWATPHSEPDLEPSQRLLAMSREDWRNLDESMFDELFTGSAIRRAGFRSLRRNLDFVGYERSV
jgi:epoxyqueuosine reductase